jgi:transcriptional regulator GlxA family with amidase domain
VDCTAALICLAELVERERIYVDADMSLPVLAERMALSTHQLSELMNTRLGKGFSRYLREARVAAVKTMLCEELSASVLSVGLSVGFTSQSTFYDAFREIEGMTPGQFRKLHSQEKSS